MKKLLKSLIFFSLIVLPTMTLAQHHQSRMSKSIDTRTPLPMTAMMSAHQLSMMRDHLEAVQAIVQAMGTKNYKAMEEASKRLASSPQMTMMCNHMGKGSSGYPEMGLALHKAADRLVVDAKNKNYQQFVKNLGTTLKTCTSCHSTYRQKIISEEEFNKLP